MNDSINRQAAIDTFDGVKVDEGYCTEYEIGYNDGIDFAISQLSVLPSVQPEIIRCKDCKYAYSTYNGNGSCKHWDKLVDEDGIPMTVYLDGDFYCGFAERRTE